MTTKGKEITAVFRYVQQVYKECQRIILKMDNLMAPNWKPLYGNRITSEVSASLMYPDDWLPEGIFRIYESDDKQINKGITITFNGLVDEPIITAGKITYSDINNRKYWDLWYS